LEEAMIAGCDRRAAARAVLLFLILGAAGLGGAPARASSAAVGVRYGWADATGELFEGSPDLGGCDLVGVQLGIGLASILQVEVAGEYVSQPFDFARGLFAGVEAAGRGDYQDLTLLATARLQIFTMTFLPLKLYAGGGANVHYANLELHDVTEVPSARFGTGDLEDAIRDVAGKTTQVGWHLVAGTRLAFTGFPFSFFLEGRYQDPFKRDDGVPTSKSVYLGAELSL
jgi:hypothetical protein